MENNEAYIDKMISELAELGIEPPNNGDKHEVTNLNNFEMQTILNMQNITGVKYSDEQIKILSHKGNACILACAGSGKTTVSTHLIAKRIMTGEIKDVSKLIYTTYSNAGASEMKQRLDTLLKQLGVNYNVQVRTIHSFFLQVIRTFGINSSIIESKDRSKIIKQGCKEAGFETKDDELGIVDNLLSYQVNNLLSDKKLLESCVNTLEKLELEQYSTIRGYYAKKKNELGVIDFDDMQSLLYLWLIKMAKSTNNAEVELSKSVRDYCKAMYTDFYIDEAQDVSKIQFAIVRAIVEDNDNKGKLDKNLVFIGDDDQCIYQWRGSDPNIILSIGATFNMNTFVLSTNYRCYNEIVDYATTGIKCNGSRYDKGMSAFANGGSVKILPSEKKDLCNLSILAMNHIKYWLSTGDRAKDIAVLSRNNFHLAILSNMLLREGIYCNMTEDMKLTKSFMYKDIKLLIEMTNTTWKSEATSGVLWKMCRFLGTQSARSIALFQDTCSLSFDDTIKYIVKTYIDKSVDFDKKVSVSMQADEKLKYTMSKLGMETREDLRTLYDIVVSDDKVNRLTSLMYLYLNGTSFLYKSLDSSRSVNGLVAYICNLMKKDGYEKMLDFLRVTEQLEYGKMVIPGEKVTLTTIHSAKGREWKDIIMFGCDNITQPSFDGIRTMLKKDVSVHDVFEYLDEERRLFYVGNTRAKENLLVITYGEPSIFVLEALGTFGKPENGNNNTILDIISSDNVVEKYNDVIEKHIMDEDSKYYYKKEDYKTK